MATIIIPTPLRKFTDRRNRLSVNGNTVREAIEELAFNYPDVRKHLIDDHGKLRTFVNIFVSDDDIRNLKNEYTPLCSEDVISIIPAIAGGME
ncbi:MAG: MoaD/ThiS family protein [Crocinitomicaceae bacterium]|nr:MoaD/ThiS family protein [Crocinitomicaceae bacterium]